MDKSVQDTKSVVSARNSGREAKFMRTNKMGMLSPPVKDISKSISKDKSIYVNQSLVTQRNANKGVKTDNRNSLGRNHDGVEEIIEEKY